MASRRMSARSDGGPGFCHTHDRALGGRLAQPGIAVKVRPASAEYERWNCEMAPSSSVASQVIEYGAVDGTTVFRPGAMMPATGTAVSTTVMVTESLDVSPCPSSTVSVKSYTPGSTKPDEILPRKNHGATSPLLHEKSSQ